MDIEGGETERRQLSDTRVAELFSSSEAIPVRALLIGEHIDLKTIEATQSLAFYPLVVRAGSRGIAILFRYGVVVFFGMDPIEEVAFLHNIKPFISDAYEKIEREAVEIRLDSGREERLENGAIYLKQMDVPHVQIISCILAKSVVLAKYEITVKDAFDSIEPLAIGMKRGRHAGHGRKLLRHISDTLLIRQRMVGRVEILEKPEVLWDHQELDRLYVRLEDEYELRERHIALERKLELVWDTAETITDLLRHRSSIRVEWYIVFLIIGEFMLSIYESFFR